MGSIEEQLQAFIGRELHKLAWERAYPINPSIALWSFFEAFRQEGAAVFIDGKEKTARFNILAPVKGGSELFETTLTFQEILTGWDGRLVSTPRALYDSICSVFDRIEERFVDPAGQYTNSDERERLSKMGNRDSRRIRAKMEANWLPFFSKHHEHMLLPTAGSIPDLAEPKIFYRVLKKFPLKLLIQAERMEAANDSPGCGPTVETLLDSDWDTFDEKYHPSSRTMDTYFWGLYMNELSKEKGYPLRKNGNRLRYILSQEASAFVNGQEIAWRHPPLIR